jgi:hypothetical protein
MDTRKTIKAGVQRRLGIRKTVVVQGSRERVQCSAVSVKQRTTGAEEVTDS